jgi:hypothetical protein
MSPEERVFIVLHRVGGEVQVTRSSALGVSNQMLKSAELASR